MFVWAIAKWERDVFLFLYPNPGSDINNNKYRLLANLHNGCFEISCGLLHNDSFPDLYDTSLPKNHNINNISQIKPEPPIKENEFQALLSSDKYYISIKYFIKMYSNLFMYKICQIG